METSRLALAICSADKTGLIDRASGIAIAACAFELPAPGAGNTIEIQLTPTGEFRARDGRPEKIPAWRIDSSIAAQVIARWQQRQTQTVVDYEHQTLKAEDNGQPAPAAGWITALSWREGQGLFATVELTDRAKQLVAAREYRYVSPVMTYDARTGAVRDVVMAAITNYPAIDGMQPLELRAAATFGLHEEEPMNKKLLAALCTLFAIADSAANDDLLIAAATAAKSKLDGYDGLAKACGLKADAAPADVLAALTAQLDQAAKLREALGIAADVAPATAITACTALKAKADSNTASGEPDPAKYVPVAVVKELQTQVAALTTKQRDGEVADLVEVALSDGRLLPAQKDWATRLGQSDVAQLRAYLDTAQPIAALRGTQTRGQPPATGDNAQGLTHEELAICTATGVTPDEFAKSKKSLAA